MYNPFVDKNKFSVLMFLLLLAFAKLFAHDESSLFQKIYRCQIADVWNKYEIEEDVESKKLIVEELKQKINDHNIVTPVTQLREQQKEIINQLIAVTNSLQEEISKPDSDPKKLQLLEHQLQAHIFSYLEFEKTISDFKSEQFWKISKTILVILVLFIFSTIYLTFNYNNAKQRARRQKDFNNKIIQVQEEERERLSRELHDTVTQDIRTSLLFVRNLKDRQGCAQPEERELIEKIENLETQNLINIRNIIQNLTPPEIENANLNTLLAEFCGNISAMAKIKCTFFAESNLKPDCFNTFQKLNIFRIIQEAVTNAVKHANASEINILVRKKTEDASTFIFFISDDGHGFNAQGHNADSKEDILSQSTHLGLKGMQTRAQLIDAKLEIYSDEDCGTEVRLEAHC